MKFRNTNPSSPLSFECGGTVYDVPVGGSCEIPDRFAYAVEGMRLQLEPVTEEPVAKQEEPRRPTQDQASRQQQK